MNKNWFDVDFKIIRDNVHGDIIIDKKYLDIINTPEFQRLRRIKQLSVADVVFPGADHTRFSHSIGTFFVMKKIISHLNSEFEKLDKKLDIREIDLALVSALVHDIGHGPFSHAFEKMISDEQKSHEEWTVEIIKSKKTKINKVLRSNFDDKFPSDVANLIEKKEIKTKPQISLDINKILTSLVSSQLDADRLDYLVRDSYNSGVKFGNIDLERLISSLKLTVHKDNYSLYIPIKYLHDIEEYLFSRFQMNKSVYYHAIKIEFEEIIKLIFRRAIELYNAKKLNMDDPVLLKVFSDTLDVISYCELDESKIVSAFQEWSKSNDFILSNLCNAYLYRNKFIKLTILDQSSKQIHRFFKDLFSILNIKDEFSEEYFKDQYYLIDKDYSFSMYKKNKENLKFLDKSGKLLDFSEATEIFINEKENILSNVKSRILFLNIEIIKNKYKLPKDKVEKILELINLYDSRNHLEIEQKYIIEDEESFKRIKNEIKIKFPSIRDRSSALQIDTYFDTLERDFSLNNETVRIRKKGNDYILTFKTSLSDDEVDLISEQNERFEFEEKVENNDISEHIDFINEKTKQNINIREKLFSEIIIIKNNRHKFDINYHNTDIEIAFDDFEYFKKNNDEEIFMGKNYQIELELKSSYSKKINLLSFCDELNKTFTELQKTTKSKLQIGIDYLDK